MTLNGIIVVLKKNLTLNLSKHSIGDLKNIVVNFNNFNLKNLLSRKPAICMEAISGNDLGINITTFVFNIERSLICILRLTITF